MINVAFMGRAVTAAETKTTNGGKSVTEFRGATDHGYGENKTPEFFTVQMWGQRGDFVQKYLSKGQQFYVKGELYHRTYKAQDGTDRMVVMINADDVELIRSGASAENEDRPKAQARSKAKQSEASDSDIPF